MTTTISRGFPTEFEATQFITQNGFTVKKWFTFPPNEKELELNQCFLIPNPPSNPKEWKVICNVPPGQGNIAKPL
jgi:hypothetical protein